MHSDADSKRESMAKDEYLIAAKILLFNGKGELLITRDKHNDWDIPGGRIRRDQFDTPLEEILREKISVELGDKISYTVGDIVTTLRLKRKELGRNNEEVRIFAVVYRGELIGGHVETGLYHVEYKWIKPTPEELKKYKSEASWVTLLEGYFNERKRTT